MPKTFMANLGLLLLRLALGSIMVGHGIQKFFGLFNGDSVEKLAELLANQHSAMTEMIGSLQVSEILAWLVAIAELVGGILVLLGVFARFGAFWFIVVMVGAIVLVHWQHGFFLKPGALGFEFNLALIGLAAGVLFLGAGDFAVLPSRHKPPKAVE